jgi:hypothetical protein
MVKSTSEVSLKVLRFKSLKHKVTAGSIPSDPGPSHIVHEQIGLQSLVPLYLPINLFQQELLKLARAQVKCGHANALL